MYISCSQINIHAIPLEFVGIAIKIKFRKVIPNFLHIPDWFSEEGNFKEDVQDKVLFLIISSGPGPRLRTGHSADTTSQLSGYQGARCSQTTSDHRKIKIKIIIKTFFLEIYSSVH